MSISIGNLSISKIYYGTTEVSCLYWGTTKVWQKSLPQLNAPTIEITETYDYDFDNGVVTLTSAPYSQTGGEVTIL